MVRDLCQICGEPFDVPDHGCQHHCIDCCDCCDYETQYDEEDEQDERYHVRVEEDR